MRTARVALRFEHLTGTFFGIFDGLLVAYGEQERAKDVQHAAIRI